MRQGAEPATPIDPDAYTDEYFRTALEGHEQFAASGGRQLSSRLARALELAEPQPGQRVLDLACGRGEMVLQSALRGAYAVGIDYAQAAMAVARQSLDGDIADCRAALARMDATHLAFRPETFDLAFMLDFVEHVRQAELEQALEEVRRTLKPGGRLLIHTSPNRLFEEVVYRHYVRNVHRLILAVARLLRLRGRFFNRLVLPTGPLPPHDEYERRLHVNPQSAGTLCAALQRHGFRVRRVDLWEPTHGRFFDAELRWHNFWVQVLDVVRFLRPFSRFPPLNRLFSNHIWVVAQRR
jgi:ubiquinone/menaquinone biosynthesis C-methylase UbiE